jgi:hypothetical protein
MEVIMKLIKLNRGFVTKVDNADYDSLNKWQWTVAKRKNVYYATRTEYPSNKLILMHREILGVDKNHRVDHRDMDGLNNQRFNLRECTSSQNAMNGNGRSGSSIYRGVSIRKRVPCKKDPLGLRNRYIARIGVGFKEIFLGRFNSEEDAAKAWNEAAIKYFGEFAKLNNV